MGYISTGPKDDKSFVKTSESCMSSAAEWGFKGGAMGATYAAFHMNQQIGVLGLPEMVGQGLVRHALPGALAGAVFASTTCLLDNTRGKDKPVSNAFLGGLAAGFVVGTKFHNPWTSLKLGLAFGAVAAAIRACAVDAVFTHDPQARLDHVNKTLYLSTIKHLGPK